MQVLVEIRKTILAMKPILELANIHDKSIEKLVVLLMKVEKEEQLEEFLIWLKRVHDGPVKEVRDIYSLKPPEWWVNMGLLGVEHTREFRLLATAKKRLRAAWRTRYGQAAPSDSDAGETDPNGLPVQSTETRPDESDSTD